MAEEQFDVVDQQDRVLWQAPRSEVHARQWLHRAAHIFVFNSRGELLIHRRSATKDECPLMFTSSASGHLAAGEGYEIAAVRELEEELGLKSPIQFLTVIPANGPHTSHEHSGLFRTVTDTPPCFDPEEIESGEFLSLTEVSRRVSEAPQLFTPCFRTLFQWYIEHAATRVPVLKRIAIYPLKSFDPVLVDNVDLLAGGALKHDRQFRFIDSVGKSVNAKRTAQIHPLQVSLDLISRVLTARLRTEATPRHWQIDRERSSLEQWCSAYFSMDVTLVENDVEGFPDDHVATGPTLVSTQTLQQVVDWFPGLSLDDVRLRFRANLEIDAPEPFWEDRLFGPTSDPERQFRIGTVVFAGTNPCQRCAVPSRDPVSGTVWPQFARTFSEERASMLPAWAPRDRFDHFYRLAVNTRMISPGDGALSVGMTVERVGE
jgi:isopentenyl-diphosphate delta-isomerase type 1